MSSYGETVDFLKQHTDVVELADDSGARVAICPQWVGRVMTSTCNGPEGQSFGFVNRDFIAAGNPDPKFSNYGGEDRLWLSPEGGQFSLWFKPGEQQSIDNWATAPALNEGAWTVASDPGEPGCRMTARMQLLNASATEFDLQVDRDVQLPAAADVRQLLGDAAGRLGDGLEMVAYETVNKITNRAADFNRETGLVSIWILGMLDAGPRTVVIVPYEPGGQDQLGPVVKADYFGQIPPQRLRIHPGAVLFAADGKCRSKIGTSQRRARNLLGSIDFQGNVLTVVRFSMPERPAEHLYMNNIWEVPLEDPYVGDVANAYNDGPNELGQQLGAFYEIESLSPAVALKTGESLEHRHRTIHIRADAATLNGLAEEIFGVELEAVREDMLGG